MEYRKWTWSMRSIPQILSYLWSDILNAERMKSACKFIGAEHNSITTRSIVVDYVLTSLIWIRQKIWELPWSSSFIKNVKGKTSPYFLGKLFSNIGRKFSRQYAQTISSLENRWQLDLLAY